jgi:SNF2 family DNA or RNA helicase
VFEECPDAEPALIVAPLSLLENWTEEIERFFKAASLPILTAYGPNLAQLKLPRENIDEQLQGEGLVKFLRPGWRGTSRIVLTTYETLRDLEFSFAAEKWSIMVCDEAQRIKNPNAMVTRAAKKQTSGSALLVRGRP